MASDHRGREVHAGKRTVQEKIAYPTYAEEGSQPGPKKMPSEKELADKYESQERIRHRDMLIGLMEEAVRRRLEEKYKAGPIHGPKRPGIPKDGKPSDKPRDLFY